MTTIVTRAGKGSSLSWVEADANFTNLNNDKVETTAIADMATKTGIETFTNKTINLTSNTLTGTLAQFNTAVSDANLVSLAGIETLTNKSIPESTNRLEFIPSGTGAIATTVQNKLRESVSVEDFLPSGYVTDGSVDYSAQFQLALNSVGNGKIVRFSNSYYLASSITIPANVTLQGPVVASGEQLFNNWESDKVVGTLFLASTATINVGAGAALDKVQILNVALRNGLPFANLTAAQAAVASYAGTAITITGPDAMVSNAAVGGFAQAYICDTKERPKVNWMLVDCTAGLLFNNIYDIPRVENVQCWAFLTAHQFGSVAISLRTGSAFKTTGHFDGGMFSQCFSYGWQVGFDIASDEAVTLNQCFADYYAPGANNGQIGYKFTVSADLIQLIGCGASGQNNGIYVNTSGKVTIIGCNFWGNKQHIVSDQHGHLIVSNCMLRDVNGGWSGNYAVVVNSGVTGTTNIIGNHLSSNTGFSVATAPLENLTSLGNTFDATATDTLGDRKLCDNQVNTITYSVFNAFGTSNNFNYRHASGTAAAPGVSPGGVQVGKSSYQVHTGAAFGSMAVSRVQSYGGNPGAGTTPGAFVWSTTPVGSASSTDRMVLTNSGVLMPFTDNAYTCGQSGNRWSALWAANGVVQTSDYRTKENIEPSVLGLDFIKALRPVSYKWKVGGNEVIRQVYRDTDGNEVDGNTVGAIPSEVITKEKPGTRTHWGLVAQEVKAATDAAGVDFAGWVLTDKNDPDSQQALRYDQFISPLIKAVQEQQAQIDRQEAVIGAIQSQLELLVTGN